MPLVHAEQQQTLKRTRTVVEVSANEFALELSRALSLAMMIASSIIAKTM
jgi:hypothetical protein